MSESLDMVERIRSEVETSGMTRSGLLEAIKETLREIRLSLPNYRAIQETKRYQLTMSDVEDSELMYQQFKDDSAGVFEDQDFQETLIVIRIKLATITDVVDRHARGEWETPRD